MNPGASTADVIGGCDAWSHVAGSRVGVLVVHGFTGTPASVRGIAEAMAAAGYDVELPRLPGHGTTVDDMLTTDWSAWGGEVSSAVERLSARATHVVAVGQSMGGTLVLRAALDHAAIGALVCINPLTRGEPSMGRAARPMALKGSPRNRVCTQVPSLLGSTSTLDRLDQKSQHRRDVASRPERLVGPDADSDRRGRGESRYR